MQGNVGVMPAQSCAKQQVAGAFLNDLEVEEARVVFQHSAQGQWKHAHSLPAGLTELQCVVATPLHIDHGQRRAAGACRRTQRDAIAEVIADQRLHVVREVGQQAGGTGLAGWHCVSAIIHRFEDGPVAVEMHASAMALRCQRQEFRRTVAVRHRATERPMDEVAHCVRQAFASGPHLARCVLQAAGDMFLSEQHRGTRIGGNDGGSQRLQFSHDPIGALQKGNAVQTACPGWTQAPRALHRHGTCKVATCRADEHDAFAQAKRVEQLHGGPQHRSAKSLKRVIHRHRCRVLHEDSGLTTAARAFPYDVAAKKRLGDVRPIGHETAQCVKPNNGIGDPVVELTHQIGLAGDRKVLQTPACRVADQSTVQP